MTQLPHGQLLCNGPLIKKGIVQQRKTKKSHTLQSTQPVTRILRHHQYRTTLSFFGDFYTMEPIFCTLWFPILKYGRINRKIHLFKDIPYSQFTPIISYQMVTSILIAYKAVIVEARSKIPIRPAENLNMASVRSVILIAFMLVDHDDLVVTNE